MLSSIWDCDKETIEKREEESGRDGITTLKVPPNPEMLTGFTIMLCFKARGGKFVK